jgi:type IV pilus assembly protein PilY1
MKSKGLFLSIFILCLLPAVFCFAHDTDLYMSSGEGVEPNILIIFDNSGSMNDQIQAYFYDPLNTYDPLVVSQDYRDTVYYRTTAGVWKVFGSGHIHDVPCPAAQTALTNQGHYEGRTNSTCSSNTYTLRTGNYRNYLQSIGGSEYVTKLAIAKRVIKEFLSTINGVRVGFMVFNRVVTINGVSESEGGRIQSAIKSLTDTNRTQLKADIDAIVAETWTPLAETLYEAGLYFKGGSSYFNAGVQYVSPIQYYCQRNYVVLITDGDSTRDRNSILRTAVGDKDGDGREPGGAHEVHYIVDGQDMLGTDYLDDVAKYLYDTDLSSSYEGKQNISTYTIGFTVQSQHQLLARTATQGHGKYFYCDNAQGLASSFQNIIDDILMRTSSFVAPIVPISRMERTSAGDKLYLALFKPVKDRMWSGNIKKFGVAQTENISEGISVGDLVDSAGKKVLDSNGQIVTTSRSFWTTAPMDGNEVEVGGLGEVLLNRSTARAIYSYLGSNTDLTHTSNAFTTGNALITPMTLGLATGDTTGRDNLIKFIHGYDAYDDDGNGDKSEKRDWLLGSFLHSRPIIVHYSETESAIYAGSNDGMLHAFDDATGEELWAFIPPNLLNKLQALHSDVIASMVDGSPKAYLGSDKKVLIFGERRGGDYYLALDITDRLTPKLLWEIGPSTLGFEEMGPELGQSWSTPQIGKIRQGLSDRWVAFIGGGYDDNQDNSPVTLPDSKGRAVYAVDVLTGALVWRYSHAQNPSMAYSIPSDISKIDIDGDGRIDRLYVGDMGGQMWRFDVGDSDPVNWTGKIIFAGTGDQRKIFYPPDVTLERDSTDYEMIFFGTGDREHPKESTTVNRIYAVKDKNSSTPLTETDLVDVTLDLLQDPNTSGADKDHIRILLNQKSGWFIKLDVNLGEKVLAPPVVFYKTAYFTTFAPTFGTTGDPCYVGEGTARLYVLRYDTGNAAFNLDVSNDTGGPVVRRSDRAGVIGTAMPSGVIITFFGGSAVGYAGVGGGVYTPMLPSTKSLIPINWKIVF